MFERACRLAKLVIVTGFAVLLHVAMAAAHASLTASEPADGSIVQTPPRAFTLTFNEPVAPQVLTLVAPDGATAPLTSFVARDRTLEINAPGQLGRGTFVLNWRVVSEDGHPIGGAIVFSVGAPSTGKPPATVTVRPAVQTGLWVAKSALYLGLFFGVGGVFATRVLMPELTARARWTLALLAVGCLGAVASLGFQGLDALGEPLEQLASAKIWKAAFSTTFGGTFLVAMASFVAAFFGWANGGRTGAIAACLGLACIGLALALSGHASAAHPQWLMRPVVAVHAIAVAAWVGSLIPLGRAMRRPDTRSADALRRFSRVIPVVVVALLASGTILTLVQVGAWAGLATAYGNVLQVKLALVSLLLLIAAINRWRLTKPVERGDASAAQSLAHLIVVEVVIVTLILGTVALWRFTPPPRSTLQPSVHQTTAHLHGETAMAMLSMTQMGSGEVRVMASLLGGDGAPLQAKSVDLTFSKPGAGIEPFKRPMSKMDDGDWETGSLVLPATGKWAVRLDILISDFEMARLAGEIDGP